MNSIPTSPAAAGRRGNGIPRVHRCHHRAPVSFISFWRAAAIVLNDLASSAYYAGGEAEGYIGKAAPWFILGIMLFSYCVRAIYVESCSMFVRGGVYRVVKEAMGSTLAKFSVSALMFDYILTGPISGVSAGQYLRRAHQRNLRVRPSISSFRRASAPRCFAIIVTAYFWWYNIKGVHESSQKAMRIMQITTVMVVILIVWCIVHRCFAASVHSAVPQCHTTSSWTRIPWAGSMAPALWASRILPALSPIFIGLGHSVLAMSGEESLAQVYREIEHPKLPNLKKAGLVIFIYSLVFTSLVSFFAVMIIPDNVRQGYLENLIGGLAMSLEGPFLMRLIFHGFVVVVGTLILAGAVNTAIVGSNGVLNRVSEDGVLADWFRQPHRRFGTSYRIINIICLLQMITIVISRGNVDFLANLYAFGVIWSFAMKGLAVLVLRYTHPGDREYRVPLNFTIGGVEIPLGLSLITLMLLAIAVINLFTKVQATIAGVTFSVGLFIVFTLSEKYMLHRRGNTAHVEMDQFHLETEGELTPQSVGARPGNILVPVSNVHALYHLGNVLDRVKPSRRDVVVLHVRLLRRAASGEYDLDASQLFGGIEQQLFSQTLSLAEKRGKSVRLAVVSANGLWEGILRAATSLESSTIVVGHSARENTEEQAREIGVAWENLGDQKPQFNLEIHLPNGDKSYKVLGPHAPNLTANEVNLLHRIWLRFSEALGGSHELHHHDVVHFALEEVKKELEQGREEEVLERLRTHLAANSGKKPPLG